VGLKGGTWGSEKKEKSVDDYTSVILKNELVYQNKENTNEQRQQKAGVYSTQTLSLLRFKEDQKGNHRGN
jgi:hypothetical protein